MLSCCCSTSGTCSASFSVLVKDCDGTPISGATVLISASGSVQSSGATDGSGIFTSTYTGCTFTVTVAYGGLTYGPISQTLTNGSTIQMNIMYAAAASVDASISDLDTGSVVCSHTTTTTAYLGPPLGIDPSTGKAILGSYSFGCGSGTEGSDGTGHYKVKPPGYWAVCGLPQPTIFCHDDHRPVTYLVASQSTWNGTGCCAGCGTDPLGNRTGAIPHKLYAQFSGTAVGSDDGVWIELNWDSTSWTGNPLSLVYVGSSAQPMRYESACRGPNGTDYICRSGGLDQSHPYQSAKAYFYVYPFKSGRCVASLSYVNYVLSDCTDGCPTNSDDPRPCCADASDSTFIATNKTTGWDTSETLVSSGNLIDNNTGNSGASFCPTASVNVSSSGGTGSGKVCETPGCGSYGDGDGLMMMSLKTIKPYQVKPLPMQPKKHEDRVLIVSRYREDLTWVKQSPIPAIVYNHGDHIELDGVEVVDLPNTGREAACMLQYICSHYFTLPKTIFFVQSESHADHLCERLKLDYSEVTPLTTQYMTGFPSDEIKEMDLVFEHSGFECRSGSAAFLGGRSPKVNLPWLTAIWRQFLDCRMPELENWNFIYASEMAVPREAIQSRPLSFWNYCRDMANRPEHQKELTIGSAWAFEALWIYLLDDRYSVKLP